MKIKSIVISVLSLFLIVIGLLAFRLFSISKDFSAVSGLKGMATIFSGNDVAEFTGKKSDVVLMSKANDIGKNAILSSLEERGYKVNDQMGAVLICEKNNKKVNILCEMYTKRYIVYFIPNEES